MEGPRAPEVHEYTNIIRFLDESLRPGKPWSISSEYPTALNPHNLHNIRVITENGNVVSHAVIKPLIIKTPAAVFKVAAIGSVVTNTTHRNQGLSKQIIEGCLEEAQKQQCDFAVLWTNLYDFYRKFGFELAGSEVSIFVEEPLELQPLAISIREGANVDPAAIHRLYAKHTVGSVRTIEEIRSYLKIPNSHVYTAWDSSGALVAYAIEGKGADLDGYIHEWGGGTQEMLHLVNHIVKNQKRGITLIAPAHSVNLIQRFRERSCMTHEGHLGMIKITNPDSLISKIVRHAKTDCGLHDLVLEKTSHSYHVGIKGGTIKTATEAELVKIIFASHRLLDLNFFDKKTAETLERIFPMRMWFWGWDSI